MAEDRLPPEPKDSPEPPYRDIRRWCIQQQAPLRPTELQREFRVTYSRAAQLLEEMETDLVLRRLQDGRFTAELAGPRDTQGLRLRPNLRKERHPVQSCEICGWCVPAELRTSPIKTGCHEHHVVPVSRGGDHGPENRALLCPNHHQLAHALYPLSKRRYRGPATREDLLRALRHADENPGEFLAEQARAFVNKLRDTPSPEEWRALPAEDPLPPPRPKARRLPSPSARHVRRHVHERHGGAIWDCSRCAEERTDEPI